ncbi:pitrilysin family protein [Desulfovibrio sp. X2]|uniref:M16 family metallopeptidase n=1 Tax=Desulfovibrio sp. X2 TaxID=941449 RepID=UPI00040D0868|nr:pitrilysin family protein [Desulfovibrio sp. X2]
MGRLEKVDRKDRAPLMSPLPPVGTTPQAGDTAPHLTVFENGFRVLVQRDTRFPLASVRLYVHAGSAWETAREAGISHLLEHMVFDGTKRRGPGEAAREIESAGGDMNAATSFDDTVYYANMPREHWRLGLDVIEDMAVHAAIDPDEFTRERKVVLSELEMDEDDPGHRQFQSLQALVWPGSVYGRPIIGTRETLAALTPRDLHAYVRRLYQPRSMLLVVVGDVNEAEVLEAAQQLFGGLRNTTIRPTAQELPLPLFTGPVARVEHGKFNKAYVSLAFPVPGLRRDQAVGLELLAQLLGGDNTSRLYRTWKYDKQMVDQVSADILTLERGGMFIVQATCDADKAEAFVRGVCDQLAHLDPASFTPEELSRARLNLEDDLFRSKETISGLASKLGYFTFFEDGPVSEDNYLFALRHTDTATLADVMHAYIRPDRLAMDLILPEAAASGTEGSGGSGATSGTAAPAPAPLTADALVAAAKASWPANAATTGTQAGTEAGAEAGSEAATAPGTAATPEVVRIGQDSVVLMPDTTLPYVSVDIAWQGGSSLEAKKSDGLSDFTARFLGKGVQGMDVIARQDFLADRAASLGAAARRDAFLVSADFPARFSKDLLPLIRKTVLEPTFPEDQLGRVRSEQTAAIKRREDQPLGLAFRHLFPFLFTGPGYGSLQMGTPESVRTLTAAEAKSFWERQRRAPFVMAVCGDFDREAVLGLAKELAAALGPVEPAPMPAPSWNAQRTDTLHLPGRNQAHILEIFPVPGLGSPETPALNVLKEALAGQSGLLFSDLRDKQGLGYSVTAMLWQTPATGFLAFYIGTEPAKAEQAKKGFDQVVARLHDSDLSNDEVARAVNILRGDYWRDRQSLASRSGEAAWLLTRGLPLDYNEKMIGEAAKVTPADLKALANKVLQPDKAYTFMVEP